MKKLKKEDIKQEVFDLYDDYAHNKINRRQFIENLSVFAVGAITVPSLLSFIMQNYVDCLSQKLVKKGYLLIDSITEWDDVKKLKRKNPGLKFISFCPARYGLGWGDS